jgi:hypothetical protein
MTNTTESGANRLPNDIGKPPSITKQKRLREEEQKRLREEEQKRLRGKEPGSMKEKLTSTKGPSHDHEVGFLGERDLRKRFPALNWTIDEKNAGFMAITKRDNKNAERKATKKKEFCKMMRNIQDLWILHETHNKNEKLMQALNDLDRAINTYNTEVSNDMAQNESTIAGLEKKPEGSTQKRQNKQHQQTDIEYIVVSD